MRLILSGVVNCHQNLTIVLGHLGEGVAYWLRRINNRHAFTGRALGAPGGIPPLCGCGQRGCEPIVEA